MIKLEDYNILKKIGSGGMGDVYLAEHKVLEIKVAIKSLHGNLVNDESFRTRFRTEAKIHSKLDHPNVVKLIDFQERENGLFIIMEYVEGKQLDDYINNESGPIPEEKLVSLFLQIVDAISHAHAKGLVHRDIKPANVIIYEGKIKVLDFGIAKELSTESGLTKTGVQVGTVAYMSPEQVNAEKVDKLTDIYSLGVTLFYMAAGKPPYENSNAIKMGIKILSEPFPIAQEFYPGVSNKIEAIIKKATQKKKTDRYQSCEEFKKDLNSNNVVVPEVGKVSAKKKAVEKKKMSGINKVLFGVVLLGLIIFSLAYFLPKKSENSYLENYNKAIIHVDNEKYQLAVDEFSACLRINTDSDSILFQRGGCYYHLGEYEKSINDLSKAILLNPKEAEYYSGRGDAYYVYEKSQEAINDYTKAIDLDANDEWNYSGRGDAYYDLEKYQEAINDFTKAISIDPKYFSFLYRGISYYKLPQASVVEYKIAINDFTTVISLKPDNKLAYKYRGMAKEASGITYEIPFCTDYQKGCELGDKDACKWWYNEECVAVVDSIEEDIQSESNNSQNNFNKKSKKEEEEEEECIPCGYCHLHTGQCCD